ncbi:MAG TPA: hypothetical protein VN610_11560, partial [Bryobacteraceae bacterium]|nr:hypothetical protein [Bryobacteraceae bacterium]
DHSTVVGIPGRVVRTRMDVDVEAEHLLDHGKLPDPQGQLLEDLSRRMAELESKMQAVADEKALAAPNDRDGRPKA